MKARRISKTLPPESIIMALCACGLYGAEPPPATDPGAAPAAPPALRIEPSTTPPEGRWVQWYDKPAERWVEALPLGNGRLGAMAFGGVDDARIQLNEDSLWAGPIDDVPRPPADHRQTVDKARELWFAGDFKAAGRMILSAAPHRIRHCWHSTSSSGATF